MSIIRPNYICIYCGKKKKIRSYLNELPKDKCEKRKDRDTHFWMNEKSLSQEAFKKLHSFDNHNDAEYMYYLAICYQKSELEADVEKALSLYEKSAELGFTKSILTLAEIYEKGEILSKDYEKSLYWYKKAIVQGNKFAEFAIGRIYETNNETAKAIEMYENLANKFIDKPMLPFSTIIPFGGYFAGAFYDGAVDIMNTEVSEDVSDNLSQIPPNILFPNPYSSPNFIFKNRGLIYENGILGYEKNMKKAIENYEKAAKFGDSYSMLALYNIYKEDEFKDEEKALKYLRMAASSVCKE